MRSRKMGDPSTRFWQRVAKGDGCWLWTGSTVFGGYGKLNVYGKRTRAHRYSYELHYGKIPPGLEVRHHCDEPLCVRPDHLCLGTHAENMRDMAERGRRAGKASVWGERHGRTKVSDLEVMQIRTERASGSTYLELVERFGISMTQVARIVKGESRTRA